MRRKITRCIVVYMRFPVARCTDQHQHNNEDCGQPQRQFPTLQETQGGRRGRFTFFRLPNRRWSCRSAGQQRTTRCAVIYLCIVLMTANGTTLSCARGRRLNILDNLITAIRAEPVPRLNFRMTMSTTHYSTFMENEPLASHS